MFLQVSSEWTNATGCPQCTDGEKCRTIEDAAIIVGKDDPTVTLGGVFPWFQIGKARSITVDLQWTKVCANITQLVSGALSAHALIRQITSSSAPIVASIVVLEYPANNYTEALVNKHKVFSSVTAHSVPLDNSVTTSPPCGLDSLGPSEKVGSLTAYYMLCTYINVYWSVNSSDTPKYPTFINFRR
ncbi:hypothetical protein ANCCAN_04279 [Ancylostoma caninum]|uniref:Uncharacterized protein n=1 Tax=Ancylostoma caninum TaxID=29170 RepID=A0A368H2Y6_ANCCA|nr:hypothetical protein ANCCAN_04279 [Ancylostoma caninum]